MIRVISRVLAVAAVGVCAQVLAVPPEAVSAAELRAGDQVEVRGNGGQSYVLTVSAVRDGVLHGRCLRSGSEFRGELSAIGSMHRLSVSPQQDMGALMALVGSGLEIRDAPVTP